MLGEVKAELAGETPAELYKEDGTKILPTIVLANKADLDPTGDVLDMLKEVVGGRFKLISVSVRDGLGLEEARTEVWNLLKLNRSYCKTPGKDADRNTPIVLKKGSTLLDFAVKVHKDFANSLDYARVWGKTVFDGQRVQRDYLIEDGDVIELHN
jgi:uncharacterized protein